jgi:quinolinate synthase
MKLNTLEKVYLSLLYEVPEIQMEETLRLAAKIPMDRMMEISKKAGLVG